MSVDPLVLVPIIVALGLVLFFAVRYAYRPRRRAKRLNVRLLDRLEPLQYWSDGWESLTARELQVVERVAAGERNAEIARELNLSIGNVANVLGRIYRKLNVRNRIELVRALRDHSR